MNEVKLLYNYNEKDLVFYGSKSDGSNFVLSSRVCAHIAVGARDTIWICQRLGAGAWHWVCARGTVWVCGADGNMMICVRDIIGARDTDGVDQPLALIIGGATEAHARLSLGAAETTGPTVALGVGRLAGTPRGASKGSWVDDGKQPMTLSVGDNFGC